jgi:hypothetical protein
LSDIKRINLTDVLDYIVCPYRTTLVKTKVDYSVIADIYRRTARYYFAKLFVDISVSYDRLYKYFNLAWSECKEQFTKGIKLNTLTSLKAPLTEILHLVKGDEEVIAYDYPLFLELGEYFLIDSIDVITYSKKYDKISLIKLQENIDYNTEDLRNLYTYAFITCISKDLSFTKEIGKYGVTIYNPFLMFSYTNNQKQSIEDYKDMLYNACKAYTSNNIHPLPGKTKCANCLAKTVCKWKYTTTNITHKVTYK